MDIHDSENNLGEINNSSENTENVENKSDEKSAEMNPYAVENEGIHDELSTDNIELVVEENNRPEMNGPDANINGFNDNNIKINVFKTFYLNSYKKQLEQRQIIKNRRNDIMRSVRKDSVSNKKYNVKSMLKANYTNQKCTNPSKPRLSVLRTNNNQPMSKNNIKTANSYCNYIRAKPEVVDIGMPLPEVTRDIESFEIRADIPSITHLPCSSTANNLRIGRDLSDPNQIISPFGRELILPTGTKPKEINLGEIVTSVLQEVLTGKITNIDNAIGKLRTTYEEKNMFTNIKKREIILINFEDDTMRPVLKIEDKFLDIIKKWYEECDLLIDIEETNVSIPENIMIQDVSGVLFQDISYKHKEDYLTNYIPLIINNVISNRYIKDLERKYFNKLVNIPKTGFGLIRLDNTPTQNIDEYQKIKDLGIVIPSNINPDYTKLEKSTIEKISNPFYNGNRIINVDPGIFDKKFIYDENKIKPNEILELLPSNSIFPSSPEFDNNGNTIISTYNQTYNVLYPGFAQNSELLLDDDELLTKQKPECIYVLINDKFLQTIIIKNPNKDCLHIIKNHPEFGFVKLFDFSTTNNDIINFIEREYNKVLFNDIDEINKKLLVTSQYIEFANKQNDSNMLVSSEENQVKKYFNSKYTIDDDVNHKMKASTLYDIIINSNAVKIDSDKLAGFKTRLSKYLKDLGLQKKRYNDGFYYYGIVEKIPIFRGSERDGKLDITMKEIQNKRFEEAKNYVFQNVLINK